MAKTKTPFLSLGSQGSIGNTLTSQKRGGATLLREKPTPSYRYTLLQAYQRWLYEDYAYLWTQQDAATRAEYRAGGSRFHLTAFQYWMKVCLKTLPGLLGWWKLDEKGGAIAYDSSPYHSNGIITGASPATGAINGGAYFDGINDLISLGNPAHLINLTKKSVFLYFNIPTLTPGDKPLYWANNVDAPFGDVIISLGSVGPISWALRNTLGVQAAGYIAYSLNTTHHIGYTWDGTIIKAWFDGEQAGASQAFSGTLACTLYPIWLGYEWLNKWGKGTFDNLMIWDDALDPVLIKRWAERRYSL